MCLCPMNLSEKGSVKLMKRFAEKLASGEVCGLSTATIPKSPKNFFDLASLCHLFNELELFMWLQKKFPPGNIMEQQLAHSRREETVHHISQGLANSDKLQLKHCYVQQAQYYRQVWERNNHTANHNNSHFQHRPQRKRTTRHRPTTKTGEILVEEESDEWH
jgi:Mitochondrial degradasome RNA helicase subunit C terminal